MVNYDEEIIKSIKKGKLPKDIVLLFINVFTALDATKDFKLFDIKRLNDKDNEIYYRLRKGKYRAIFQYKNECFFVNSIDKREEVYKKWLL